MSSYADGERNEKSYEVIIRKTYAKDIMTLTQSMILARKAETAWYDAKINGGDVKQAKEQLLVAEGVVFTQKEGLLEALQAALSPGEAQEAMEEITRIAQKEAAILPEITKARSFGIS